ncbi:MAG: Tol-Pal system beta propeller repeat protein TolB, partial [Candidatus Thioglobus sp.]|nr:Tol-Pal system beta propeller repeat protein TolB [Candidatus Thioglobus sp.]
MIKLIAAFLTFYSASVFAVLEVTVLKKAEDAFPIVISPFLVKGDAKQGETIAHIMRDNFNRSGEFNASSADYIVTSQVDFDKWQAQK